MKSGLRILSLLAATVLLPGGSAFCQTFEWANQPLVSSAFGGSDEGRAVAKDASGNVYVTGFFAGTADFDPGTGTANLSSAGGQDIFIAKYNASGNYVWANRIGGASNDIAYAIALDGSGNVHITGYMQGSNVDFDPGAGTAGLSSAGAWDIFIAKYDASGNYLWANRMGGTSSEVGYGIALDGSGNVHITGAFLSTTADFDPGPGTANLTNAGNDEIFVAKYDASGNYLWAGRTGGTNSDIGYGIAVDDSGNVYATGSFRGSNVDFDPGAGTATLSSAGNSDIFISKYDASGNYVWAKRLGGTTGDEGYGIALDGSGNLHVTGYFQSSSADFDPGAGTANLSTAGGRDVFIAKYDASGNYIWAKQMGGTNDDNGYGIALDGSGNVLVAGDFLSSIVDFDPGAGTANLSTAGSTDIFAAKYDASGNYLWAKRAGGSVDDVGRSLALDGSGNVYVTGSFQGSNIDFDPGAGTANLSSAGGQDIFIAKYDASGNYVWAKRIGSSGGDESFSLALDGSGNVHVTGAFSGNVDFDPGAGTANLTTGDLDIFISKYDASGNYVWARKLGGTGFDAGFGLALDGSGNVFVTGIFGGNDADFDPGAGTAILSSVGNQDIFIAKYDASGNYVWAIDVGAEYNDIGYCIATGGPDKVNVGGNFSGTADFDPGAGAANRTLVSSSNDIFIAQYDPAIPAPEMDVRGNNQSIADGDATPDTADDTDFGSVISSLTRSFTIENTGTGDLSIGSISSDNSMFAVGALTPPGPVAPGNSATFDLTFTPATPGSHSALITIGNNDSDENPYTFAVAGTGQTAVSGRIIWENDGISGVGNATVNLTGTGTGNDLTDSNGDYLIATVPASGNFTVKPVKSINKLNGVTTGDVTAIHRHVGNATLLPGPFKRIAADVNKSNTITSLDASLVNLALLGNPPALNQITSWRFVPASHVFLNPNAPWGFPEQIMLTGAGGNISGQDFKGVKLGDVVETFADPANFGAGNPLVWRVQDQALEAGTEVVAEFRAGQMNDLTSFQFALHFDPQQLQLTEIEPLTALPVTQDHFGIYNLAEGEIRVAWAQTTAVFLSEAAPVFRLHFSVSAGGAKLSEVLQLDGDVLPGYVYNNVLAESEVVLEYDDAVTGTGPNPDAAGYLLLQNTPNPFSDKTTVAFVLPDACEATLRVFDTNGRLLQEQTAFYTAGKHEELLLLEGISGVLYVELVTERGSMTRKMVAISNGR